MHDANACLTLTYDDRHLPIGGTLVPGDLQVFIRALRDRLRPKRISFFGCGEYGENPPKDWRFDKCFGRPHYHVLIFGFDFPDKYSLPDSKAGSKQWRSPRLEKIWTKGHSSVGVVNYTSAAYVAGYVMKKITGDIAPGWYQRVDLTTGEVFDLVPEFCRMSLRPAIGKTWYQAYGTEVRQNDSVVMRGKEMKPPKYYDKLLEMNFPVDYLEVKAARQLDAEAKPEDSTFERLKVRGHVADAKRRLFRRAI